jgi:DNA-binding transcriptional ArsR family regulator
MIENPVLAQRIGNIRDDKTPVRKFENRHGFMIDDKFVTAEYARSLGHGASMVYMLLCKYADKTQTAWPSTARMEKLLGYSKRQILRSIRLLEKYNLVKTYRLQGQSNAYRLIDSEKWIPVKTIVVTKYILKRKGHDCIRKRKLTAL